MSLPVISILHPTARVKPYPGFPSGCWGAVEQFAQAAVKPHQIEYVLVVHETNWSEFWLNFGGDAPDSDRVEVAAHACELYGSFYVVQNHGRNCVVDQINEGAKHTTGQVIVGIMDDLEAPARWDARLLARMPQICRVCGEQFAPGEVMRCRCKIPGPDPHVSGEYVIDLTGEDSNWIVYSAMTRKRYERYGFVLSPEFESMYADNYYSWLAHKDGVVINGRGLGFKHHHPIFGLGVTDAVYEQQNNPRAYRQGYATYRRLTEGARVIAFLIPGKTFSHRVMFGLFEVIEYLWAKGFICERFGAHTSNVYFTRIELADAALTKGIRPDFVLSVDDDNVLSAESIDMLIADADKHPEIDIFTGWCWCDTGDYEAAPFRMSCGRQGPNLECQFFGVEDYLKMQAAGKLSITSDDVAPDAFWSGFPVVLMRARVLETLGWKSFLPMLGDDFKRGFTSEDTTFFYRAHQAGFKSAVDLRVKVPHLKLRAIEPQILPAADREKVMEFLEAQRAPLVAEALCGAD